MAITVVQSTTGGGSLATNTVTLASSTTAGNCLVVAIGSPIAVSGVTLGGSAGNFAKAVATASGQIAAIWVDPNCAGGQTAVAVTTSSAPSSGTCIAVYEVSGLATSSVVDKTNSGIGTTATYSSGASGTTTSATELWIALGTSLSSSLAAPTTGGWTSTARVQKGAGPVCYMFAGYQITTVTGTGTYTGVTGSGTNWGAAVATLLSGAASGPSPRSQKPVLTAVSRAAFW